MLNTQVNIGRYLARPPMGFSLTKQIESFNFSRHHQQVWVDINQIV